MTHIRVLELINKINNVIDKRGQHLILAFNGLLYSIILERVNDSSLTIASGLDIKQIHDRLLTI